MLQCIFDYFFELFLISDHPLSIHSMCGNICDGMFPLNCEKSVHNIGF